MVGDKQIKISFIVIGRNEGWKLSLCFKSIYKTIDYNKLGDYEIIYVDSKSTDDSVSRAQAFNEVKIIELKDNKNSAIARNVGAKRSNGSVLFFIDGDMEIVPSFLPLVYTDSTGLIYDFVSGNFENHFYNTRGELINKNNHYRLSEDEFQITTGGLFLITKNIWNSINGMNTKYVKCQDLDLGIRLSKKGIKLLRKAEILARHHTIAYTNSDRMWKTLFSNNNFYRIVLLRDHYKYLPYVKLFLRENYTGVLFFLSLVASIIHPHLSIYAPYLLITFFRAIVNMKSQFYRIPDRFLYLILRDITAFAAIFLFWPETNTEN